MKYESGKIIWNLKFLVIETASFTFPLLRIKNHMNHIKTYYQWLKPQKCMSRYLSTLLIFFAENHLSHTSHIG